jgi:hypothetical protein
MGRICAVMRSSTAVRSRPSGQQEAEQEKGLVRGVTPTRAEPELNLILDRMHSSLSGPKNDRPAFLLVRGPLVGLGGLEPPPSSLSAITRLPLCNPAFLQVAGDRQGRSDAFLATSFQAVQAGHSIGSPAGGSFASRGCRPVRSPAGQRRGPGEAAAGQQSSTRRCATVSACGRCASVPARRSATTQAARAARSAPASTAPTWAASNPANVSADRSS